MDKKTFVLNVKMKYLDKVKLKMLKSEEEQHLYLSSMENLKKLVYSDFPELEKLCESTTPVGWRSSKLEMKCEDRDGDFIVIENDEDLESFLQWQKGKHLVLHLDTKNRDSGDGPDGSLNARSSSSNSVKVETPTIHKTKACWHYARLGRCNFGTNCSFSHEQEARQDGSGRPPEQPGPSSNSNPVKPEARAKQRPCRYYAKGHCNNGNNCTFLHEQDARHDKKAIPPEQSETPRPPKDSTNFGSWLTQQLTRDPKDNITFLSRDKGLDMLKKIIERKDLPSQWIDLLVKLLTREEFRISLKREHTNKIYGLLIGSTFLVQLHGHIVTQLATAKPHEIMPYLLLTEQLQTRTTCGWKEVPLDAIDSVIQQLEESGDKKEVVLMLSRLVTYRNKLRRQASFSSTDEKTEFLGVRYKKLSIMPSKAELLQPHLSDDLPVNIVGKQYNSVYTYLETHFRLLQEDCIHPLRQGICTLRNQQSSRELRIYQRVRLARYRCGEHGIEYSLSFQENRGHRVGSKNLLYGALVCLTYDGFQESLIFGVITEGNFQGLGRRSYTVSIRVMSSSEGQVEDLETFQSIGQLASIPSSLDQAQLHALKHGLTKELSIIQGPPGTGKTFLGLLLVRILLANFKSAAEQKVQNSRPAVSRKEKGYARKGPVLVICMTNHALDQFLEGIYKFESNVI
ncbi:hypothetical protein R1flu_013371 [Riccia fluitans]|uniref:C3H1-type domain-containing protein n=1 Tax=Riccia fluitans TaxID=41844 RepID=A0ABD1YDC9_9MARC